MDNFLVHVRKYLPTAKVISERDLGQNRKAYTVSYGGSNADIGAFAISINGEQLLQWCQEKTLINEAAELKRRLLDGRPAESRLFVCVERFDYTKGIEQRLRAFQQYLRQGNGKDVYYQIAAGSRGSVSSYAEYQERVMKFAEVINEEFPDSVHMDTENHPQREVVRYYMAADVIMVTPAADGMNLVVKEAIMCNPKAVIVLSIGAGAENQFAVAGLSDCYFRVVDIEDTEAFANIIREAADLDQSVAVERGQKLFDFVKENDIQKWLDGYLDPSWCHDVSPVVKLTSLRQFQELMMEARDLRRLIVSCMINHKPFNETTVLSLQNIERSLEEKIQGADDGVTMDLNGIELDVRDEMQMLKKDCRFLEFYRNEGDIDPFIDFLAESHPRSKEEFKEEMDAVLKMLNFDLSDGLDVFITDWDGTMKTYACNYRTSIQPAYSGVILSLFANRYTKLAAVLTAGPLRDFGILDSTTVPWEEGYLAYGGSWGREWMINGKRVADESILTIEGAAALDKLAEAIERLLKTEEFSKFVVVGSGCQRKVDRITVGVQNVTGKVDERLSKRYVDAVLQEVGRIDPDRKVFDVVHLELDLELVLKTHDCLKWTKANGIRFLCELVGANLGTGNVLICGDTVSDLPMVEMAHEKNPNGTYAIFVNPNAEVKSKLVALMKEKQVVVGCPEVLHAVMAKQILRPMFVMNEV